MTSLHFEPPVTEPLAPLASRVADGVFRNAERLEFSCRGDRVPATLAMPDLRADDGPSPLVLLLRDPRGDDRLADLADLGPWVDAGLALATIDLPLQGKRRSAKLSELLEESFASAVRGDAIDATASLLWCEFAHQATIELRRLLDIVCGLPTVDASRIGFAGFGLGAFVGTLLSKVDPRPSAFVLSGGGAGFAPAVIEPAEFASTLSQKRTLLLGDSTPAAEDPFAMPRARTECLEQAAAPLRVEWTADRDAARDAAFAFLSDAFAL